MTELRAGVIGHGYTGKLHASAWLANPHAALTAVADSDASRLAGLPAGVRGYSAYEQLLADDLDAVSICLPTHLHAEATLEALARGKHVLLEKPIADNLRDARRMLMAAKAKGLTFYVGMTHRFYPELREAKAQIDAGAIGEIVAANDCVLEHLGFLNVPQWYLEKKFAGGGAALTSGVHLVDRLRWFLGDDVRAVAGRAGNSYFGADVEDSGQMFLYFRSGLSAQITFAFMREEHPLVCDLQVIGTRGSLTVHTWQSYELWNNSGRQRKVFYTQEPHPAKVQAGIAGEVEEFRASIVEGRTPWPSAEESTRAVQAILAYYESAATGRLIEIGDLHAV
ncbi:MAG: Gfo/Idh/MocA family oxidoreductase [Bryobacteraceae bacterium]|nr:Gfo/Idh/MocA family oxidoreductase [Bryobacteraceae bacterium]